MAVLENLRKGTDSTSTRVLIGVVALALILFLGDGARINSSSALATVNGAAVTQAEFDRVYRMVERQERGNLDDAGRAALQAEVLENVIAQEVFLQEAQRLGIAVSDTEVMREVVGVPAFQKDGKFDQRTYEKVLKNMGMTPERFQAERARELVLGRLGDFLGSSVAVTDAEVRRAWLESETQYDLAYIRLPDTAFLADIQVSDADRDALLASKGAEVQKRYDEAYDRAYNLPKRWTVSTILVRTDVEGADKAALQAKAEALRASAVAPGADFAALARDNSEDLSAASGGSLGTLTRDQLDPMVAIAVDSLGAGQVSPVVETGRGFQVVKVDAVEDARLIPFDEAKLDLAVQMIREEKVGAEQRAWAGKLVSAWTAGAIPPELTEPRRLAIEQPDPFRLREGTVPAVGRIPELTAALENARAGDVLPVPFQDGPNVYVVKLNQKLQPSEDSFADGSRMVRLQLQNTRQQAFVESWRADLIARAKIERHVQMGPAATPGEVPADAPAPQP